VGHPKVLHEQLVATVGRGRLVFAREATSYKFYGFIHGAYFEGIIRVADEVLRCLRDKSVQEEPGMLREWLIMELRRYDLL
jgi:hypothetical protein